MARPGWTHLNDVVYGVLILTIVRVGLIHLRMWARLVTVTFCNAFGDWHHQMLAMVFAPGTLVAFVSRFTPRRVPGQEMTCFLGPVMSYT